jgi:hypothetical protein
MIEGGNWALEFLCGASKAPPDAALRIAQAGGLNVIFEAMLETHLETWDYEVTLPDYAVDLLKALLFPTTTSLEEPHARLVPLLRDRDEEIMKHLLVWLADHARNTVQSATRAISTLGMLSCVATKWTCKPELAAAATDAIVAALRALQPKPGSSVAFVAACAEMINNFTGACGEADAAKEGTYALRAGALPLLEPTLAFLDATDNDYNDTDYESIEFVVHKLQGVRADAAMAELLAEEEAEAAARKAKAGKGAKSKAKAKASKSKSAGAATASKSPPAKSSTVVPAPAEQPMAPAPPAPVPAPPQPEAPQSSPPPLPPWLMQAMQQPAPAPPAPVATPAVQPAAPRGARPPNIAAALAATRISPPAAVPAPPQRWDAVATLLPAPPTGAWSRARPAIPGLSAGEVPRERAGVRNMSRCSRRGAHAVLRTDRLLRCVCGHANRRVPAVPREPLTPQTHAFVVDRAYDMWRSQQRDCVHRPRDSARRVALQLILRLRSRCEQLPRRAGVRPALLLARLGCPVAQLLAQLGVLAPEVLHQEGVEGRRRAAQRRQQRHHQRVGAHLRVVRRALRFASRRTRSLFITRPARMGRKSQQAAKAVLCIIMPRARTR